MHHKAKRIGAVERPFIEGFITVLNREVDQIAQVFIFSLLCVQRRRHPAFGLEAIVVSMDMLRLFEEECAKTPSPGSAMLTSVFAA